LIRLSLQQAEQPNGLEEAGSSSPCRGISRYESIDGIKEVYVLILSRIGTPINEPPMASAQILLHKGGKIGDIRRTAEEIINQELEQIDEFCRELLRGRYPVC